MAAGKAIVSTPYTYALERLAGGRGRLVAPGSTDALAGALIELASDRALRGDIWTAGVRVQPRHAVVEAGAAYRRLFSRVAAATPTAVPTASGVARTTGSPTAAFASRAAGD